MDKAASRPQVPEPAEVPHADPAEQEQREELRRTLHTRLIERIREQYERGMVRGLSVHFPQVASSYSAMADNILSQLEFAENDTDTIKAWVEEIERDQNLLQPLIEDQLRIRN